MRVTATLLLAIFCLGIDMYVVAALIPTMAGPGALRNSLLGRAIHRA